LPGCQFPTIPGDITPEPAQGERRGRVWRGKDERGKDDRKWRCMEKVGEREGRGS